MTEDQFMNLVDMATLRSRKLLQRKALEYQEGDDRLSQFKKMGAMEDKPSTECLFTLMDKHITSIAKMVKHPTLYNSKMWRGKLDDIRNYAVLLEGVLADIGVE